MKNILYTGRIAPIKGLDNLCKAVAEVNMEEWRLIIVGPDQENHTAELRKISENFGVQGLIDFVGPKYGDDLQRMYEEADIFVLPSYSENFGSVVVEALSHSIPVIATKGTPWQELEENGCGWWIDVGIKPLVEALRTAMSLRDEERQAMGRRGRKLVEEKYTWDAVVKAMISGYEEVLNARA